MCAPTVSVIMPVYNAQKYIGKAIESVLGQTYEDFEFILIDDGGNDDSVEIAKGYADQRIKMYHNRRNMGIAFSRNLAIRKSSGKYIAIMDDDDISLPDRLKQQVDFMKYNPKIDVVGGRSSIIDETGKVISESEAMQENYKMNKVMFLFYNSFHNSETLVRKSLVDQYKICYQDHLLGMEDFRFWIDCARYGRISNINTEVLQYRVTKSNETGRVRQEQAEERRKLFGNLRRYSLESNGFQLTEEEMELLNAVVNETGDGTFCNAGQVVGIFRIMDKLVKQGEVMRVEYLEELKIWLKIIFQNKISDTHHEKIWG